MNIGITAAMIERGRTGIGQYVVSLARALCAYGSEHRFVLFILEEDLPLFSTVSDRITLIAIPERYRTAVRNIGWHQTVLPALVRKHRVDVLHVPSYRRLLFSQPCATVATIHDLAPFHVPHKYDWKRMLFGRYAARWLARRQGKIITVSHTTAASVTQHFGIPPEKITVIHNGIDHGRFFPGDRQRAREFIAQRYGIASPFILYVARLEHPGKNHVNLIAAFEQFKAVNGADWQLVFAGSDWRGAATIHKAIRCASHQTSIHALGFVADADLPDLYRAAEMLVHPSHFEGFGFPPLEAMACGCPVISSAGGALPEIAGSAALYVDANNPVSIANQIIRVAEDHALRRKLCSAGLGRVTRFRWQEVAERTLNVYVEALASCLGLRGTKAPQELRSSRSWAPSGTV